MDNWPRWATEMGLRLLLAAPKVAGSPIQWWTLAWILGAAVVATLVIAVIVMVSRRPKSMEHGMAEFSRSLQAVAPTHRMGTRTTGEVRPTLGKAADGRPLRARGESETV